MNSIEHIEVLKAKLKGIVAELLKIDFNFLIDIFRKKAVGKIEIMS